MSAKFFGGMMGMVLSLIGAVQAHAQCPTTMSVTQVASGCGADVTYAVTNTAGFQFIQFAIDGTPFSTQQSGTISLDPGTYTIAVSTADANNCTMYIEEEITVLSPTGFSAFITVEATPCGGQCTGSLMTGANGGTSPYVYLWSTQEVGQTSIQLCEGAYSVEVTDANGCTTTDSVDLVEAGPTVDFFNDTVACNGTLSIDMNTTGGTGDYSFLWSPSASMLDPTAEFPTMTVGTDTTLVSVTVTDNVTGCTTTESLTVYPNVPILSTVELCSGSALLEVDPGSVMYNWSATDPDGNTIDMSSASGNWFQATVPGDYVVVTYYMGCNVTTHLFTVEACSQVCNSIINPTSTATNCYTNFCFAAGGVPSIESYSWDFAGIYSSEAPSACFPQSLAGDYEVTLTATHVGGCVSTSVVTVQATADGIEVSLPDDDGLIACNGTLFGIGPQVQGGSGDFSYLWEPTAVVNNPTSQTVGITVSAPEWVYVTVTDNVTGCMAEDSVYVSPNLPVNQSLTLCNGSALLELDPGSMMYNWSGTDPDGNAIDMSGASGNSFEATVPGDYVVVTYYSGCNVTTHLFGVEECAVECSSSFTYTQECSYTLCFNVQGTPQPITFQWDFGDGTVVNPVSQNVECHTYITYGTYTVTLETIDVNGCTNTYSQEVEVMDDLTGSLVVSVEDTVYTCAGLCEGSAIAVASGGTAPYTFYWLLDLNTTAQNTVLCEGVNTVIVTDANGCTITADVVVLEYPVQELEISYSETTENCVSNACLSASLGFLSYNWSTGSNTPTVCAFFSPSTNNALVEVVDQYGCYHSDSISFTLEDPCFDVWPGDANSDGEATNTDALWVGLAFDQTGPIRPNATLLWEGQPAPDWNFNFAQNNVNLKHADTDGNGTINFADTIAISQNYGQTHGKAENALGGGYPMLWVEATPDTVGLSQAVNVTVHLADAAMPVDSLHGIAFTLTFEAALVTQSGFSIDFSQNVLGTVGTDVLTLQQPFFTDGEVDVAISRTTLQNFSGHGPLMTARIVTTDNLSGFTELHLGVSGITAITAHENPVLFTTSPDTVIIDPDHVGVSDIFGPEFRVYPNPSTGIFQLEGLHGTVTVEVMDATGRTVAATSSQGNSRLTLDMSALPSGIYLLRASNAAGVVVKRMELVGR